MGILTCVYVQQIAHYIICCDRADYKGIVDVVIDVYVPYVDK
jgi:hypothetical protein